MEMPEGYAVIYIRWHIYVGHVSELYRCVCGLYMNVCLGCMEMRVYSPPPQMVRGAYTFVMWSHLTWVDNRVLVPFT